MAISHLKSTPVTNLDAAPIVPNTAGEGGPAPLKTVGGTVTAVAADSQNTTYQFCRVPSNAKIKQIWFESGAQGAGTIDLGVYYATDGVGGKPTTLLAANAIDQDLFASAIAITSLSQPTNVINESATFDGDKQNQPLWQAAGLSADPGGSFDIVGTLAVAVTTGTGKMGLVAAYTD